MPGGLHRHCCCEHGPCRACPRFGESITAVVSGVEMCGPCMASPVASYIEIELLSGSINGVHTLEWVPEWGGIEYCSWVSDTIARVRTTAWYSPCSGPCDCSHSQSHEHDVSISLFIRFDTFPPVTRLRMMMPEIFYYSASEIRCEGEYQNQYLICGEGTAPYFVGGTITLSR